MQFHLQCITLQLTPKGLSVQYAASILAEWPTKIINYEQFS